MKKDGSRSLVAVFYIVTNKLTRDNLTRGQRAAIVINLHYEDERRKAKERQVAAGELYGVGKEKGTSEMERATTDGEVAEILSKMSGVGKTNIYYLLAIKDKRPDLYEKVYNGAYSIGKARIAQFLKEYWGVKEGRPNKLDHNGTVSKTTLDIAEVIGETERTTKRILKLNELIPEIQEMVSASRNYRR